MACLLDGHRELLFGSYPSTAGNTFVSFGSEPLSLPGSVARRLPFPRSCAKQILINTDQGCLDLSGFKPVKNADYTVQGNELQGKPRIHPQWKELEGKRQIWDTLREYPKEDLLGKAVLVRCDLCTSFEEADGLNEEAIVEAVPTLSYLISVGARIVIASHWSSFHCSKGVTDIEHIADRLSKHLGKSVSAINAVRGLAVRDTILALINGDVLLLGNLELYKDELANNKDFSKDLAENIDILVNDAFSISHRVLASTVGAACFTSARLAGLQLERELFFWMKATSNPESPFVAIIGGSRLSQTLGVLYKLLETCNSVVVTGSMVFTFFKALEYCCPSTFIENELVPDTIKFLSVAAAKNVDIILPLDLLCVRDGLVHSTFRSDNVPKGWIPISFGQKTLDKIENALLLSKMALWIGPLSLSNKVVDLQVSKSLAKIFGEISSRGCTTIVGGRQSTLAIRKEGTSGLISHISRGGAAFMELLKGINLPAVSALDFVRL